MEKDFAQIRSSNSPAHGHSGRRDIRTVNTEAHDDCERSVRPLPVAENELVAPVSGAVTLVEDAIIARYSPSIAFYRVSALRPHPSYVKHGLSVPPWKIAALDHLGDRAFDDPIVTTQDGLILDGYARWELAKKRGMLTIQCLVHQRNEDEALRDFLWRHRRFAGLNDFTRIELSRDIKSFRAEKARLNQQAGGQRKGSATLEASERVDSRKERAQTLDVSEGNVGKVDRILDHACLSTKQAVRGKEISINRAEKWSRQTEARQIENLRLLRIERGIRKKARNLVAALASPPDEGALTEADLLRLLHRVSTMSTEQSKALGPVVVGRLCVPGKGIYVTDELIQAFKPQQEVLIE